MHPIRPSHRPLAVLALALAMLSSGCAADPEATAAAPADRSLDDYRRAYAAVERSVRSLYGDGAVEAGAGLPAVSARLEAVALAPYQSPAPEPPFLEVPVILEVDADPGRRWARVDTTTRMPGFEIRSVRLLGPDGAVDVEPRSGRAFAGEFGWEDLERDFRRFPHRVIADAWERRTDLRWLGSTEVDGAEADLVAFPHLGRRQLTLAIDGEGRLLRHEHLYDDLRTGDAVVSARFLDWRREGRRWVPGRLEQHEAGLAAVTGSYERIELGAPGGEPEPGRFRPDTEVTADERRAGPPGEAPGGGTEGPPPTTELAPGVHRVELVPGGEYNCLLVDLGASFAVVEAPLGAATARRIVAAARALDPEKPIRHVIATHFHDDHAGGVPHLVAATGAAVVTSRGNEAFFRDATAARRTLAGPPVTSEGPAELLLVNAELELPGERTLRLVDVGPTGHVDEILVAWLPEAGIVFQGDLFRFPESGPVESAREGVRAGLERLLEVLAPAEEGGSGGGIRVVGVHGRVGTLEELRQAMGEG